uniref:Uncharacterized protein n=1 Tax=Megaselia scalaris TaxID=36166 RepID=T1GYS8_MEGSC
MICMQYVPNIGVLYSNNKTYPNLRVLVLLNVRPKFSLPTVSLFKEISSGHSINVHQIRHKQKDILYY